MKRAGFETPSPIQEQVIPTILAGCDVVAQAQTGTGKTAAFGLPSLSLISPDNGVALLVITPTRELAQQVGEELFRFGSGRGLRTVIIQGGSSYRNQLDQVKRGAQIVVATPGRLLDLLTSHPMPNFNPSIVVLDEADEMLNMGFLEDIQQIFTHLPEERQTLLFSATMPLPIQNLAKKILKKPIFISATGKETANRDIQQLYYVIREEERDAALLRLIHSKEPAKAIIFCRTKKEVDRLSELLESEGYRAKGLHGDLEQGQRTRVTEAFRKGAITVLVATDVAARGLNILDISHVFNFHVPLESESYLHRIGRTGRAGRKGVAVTLVTPNELRTLQRVMKPHGGEMEQRTVPTKGEIKQRKLEKLVEKIRLHPPTKEALLVLEALKKEMDLETLSLHLVSLFANQQEVEGPEAIGFSKQDTLSQKTQRRDRPDSGRFKFADKRKRKPFNKDKPFNKERSFNKEDKPFNKERSFNKEDKPFNKEAPKRSYRNAPPKKRAKPTF